ncbi:hypothetical protein JG688_00006674 [Phytophthora aleatoria]|uniref:Splicing factor 3B subunit 4 n=1 Tax=Phytophthora aleatoria TaxID=2496075 RepID=A0A8J5M8P2_9STRA|nr:hypothetical protein JG688_00006674 [Phytophthora aleatoria]
MSAAIEQRNQDATVYVGNLDDRVTEELLWELMLQAGSVCNVHMPRDKVTGAHQNYGFVEFRTEECAEYAVKVLNMIQLYGRVVRVKKASNDRKNLDVGANLFIGNLDPEVDEKLLYDTFSAFGGIVETPKIMRDPDTKASKGFGFVSFDSFEAADLAIECMHGQYLCNRQVVVQYAYKKDSHNERHGSEAERLLAQRNPNKLKPHTILWMLMATRQEEAVELPRVYLIEKISVDGGKSTLKPAARGGATLTQIEETGVVYLIGGANREGTSFGDIHRFDLDTRRWTLIKPSSGSFPPRSGHSAVAIGAKIYVFGGLDAASSGIYNDVHIFDTQTSSWTKAAIKGETPLPRNAHAAIALPQTDDSMGSRKMLVYGGSSPEYGAFNDLYLLHIPAGDNQPLRWEKCTPEADSKEEKQPAEPSPSEIPERFGHCGTTVEIQTPSKPAEKSRRQGFLIFGGMNAESDLNDLVLITQTRI